MLRRRLPGNSLLTALMLLLVLSGWGCRMVEPENLPEGEALLELLYSRIESAAQKNPGLAAVDTVGYSENDRYPIKRIILNSVQDPASDALPKVLVTGAVHGNEPLSALTAVSLAEHLIAGWNKQDQQITALLESAVIHIIPVVNPWGLVRYSRETELGVDLNRDFGSPDPDRQPDDPAWFHPWVGGFTARESRVMQEVCEEELYIFSIQGHTRYENINVPLDYLVTEEQARSSAEESFPAGTYNPIYPLMMAAAEEYAAAVSQKEDWEDFYATTGADWYVVEGSFTDWHFGALGAPGFTVEYYKWDISTPAATETARQVWEAHRDALVTLLSLSSHCVSGQIADDSAAVRVTCVLEEDGGRALNDPTPITLTAGVDPDSGFFHLLVPEGTWVLSARDEKGKVLEEKIVVIDGDDPPPRVDFSQARALPERSTGL
jgi:hypothetical protein